MKGIKAIIIDDENHAIESITTLLELYCPQVSVIDTASTMAEGKKSIINIKPDLVFLDVNLGNKTGFELLEELIPITFQLIFVTAYSEYALQAFRANALDYILKPVEPSYLQQAIKKVEKVLESNSLEDYLTDLARRVQGSRSQQLSISTIDGIIFLDIDKITKIDGSGNYSTFFMENGEKVTASKGLKYFNTLLPDNQFYTCHQSHIINLNFVSKILTKDGHIIALKNGSQVPLAKKRKEALIRLLTAKQS